MVRTGKVQTINCGSCNATFAACVEPECYSDADWQRDLRKYTKQGAKVELVDSGEFRFTSCHCDKKKKKDPNQLTLFK